MKVVVTGAAGFVGRALVVALGRRGDTALGLDRKAADVTTLDTLRSRLGEARHEALVHLAFPVASRGRVGAMAPFRETALGTANALTVAVEAGIPHVVLASSGKVYGLPRELPTPESHPLAPTTYLGELKRLQESIATTAVRCGAPVGVTVLRLFNVYGPGQREGFLVPRLLRAFREHRPLTLGELGHARDWVHVDDACEAVLAALAAPAEPGACRALNVGSGAAVSVRELIGRFEAVSGRSLLIHSEPSRGRPDEPPVECADTTLLRALGWRPRVDLRTGVRRLWRRIVRDCDTTHSSRNHRTSRNH